MQIQFSNQAEFLKKELPKEKDNYQILDKL